MDWGSVAGLVVAVGGVLIGQKLEGGHLSSLVQPAAMVIVIVGTIGAVILQSGYPRFLEGVRMLALIFRPPPDDHDKVQRDFTQWSAAARREGLLSLDRYIDSAPNAFMGKGLRLVVDGVDPASVRDILDRDIGAYEVRQKQAAKVWEAAGGYAPTVGILGAVLGLIHVMENLADPASLGSGIAVAFVATIYGVGLANLVFLPIGNRLKAIIADEVTRREMVCDVLVAIATGENHRLIEDRMAAYPR